MTIIWNTETDEILKAEDYDFETKIDDNIFDGKDYSMTNELGKTTFTKDKYECLTYWDNYELNKRGFILHWFDEDEALEYIANDMLSADTTSGNAYLYADVLKKIAELIGE